ncbi:glycoside hydrolase family 15 protein [Kitasatospora cineracea]|uniref:GH15 family glucan-1,4-alpha-glucosidase n=1 Tax=Kitasatospora cineracea TaxID=88074 RepID=A0A3N4SKR0_9ACTN|nr:glycoside hydrolase family 15 protein [Kitasatospora cineracea]RPE37144.1 GH15 family glucan-1,4-alpha-glucosidase [Kitasatospora cineracea]
MAEEPGGADLVPRPHVLREYALLADGERGALVGPHGDLAWMCAPKWESDAVFSSLIGGGGTYTVTPCEERHVWGGSYEHGTLIWHSRWMTTDGAVECREALAFPGDPDRAVLLRRITAVDGDARVRVVLDPRAGFGRHGSHHLKLNDGVWSGRTGELRWRWSGAAGATPSGRAPGRPGEALRCEVTVPAGRHHDLVLELSAAALPREPVEPDAAWRATETAWARNRPALAHTIAPRDALHSHAVLRGLTTGGGGMAAAATMCLPERADTGRSYDYRYAWIRDQCYAGLAAASVEDTVLLDSAVRFVTARLLEDGPRLKPAYTCGGGAVPDERTLDLPGYPGGGDRIGNWVNQQFQLDALGEALQLLAAAASLDRLDTDGRRALQSAVAAIGQRWGEPEAGIWELEDRHWTHSRLACVAGLRVAATSVTGGASTTCSTLADAILAETSRTCLHPDGYWQRAPQDRRTDAALLLPPVRGALPAADPRTSATVRAVREHLGDDGYVYRYRHDQRPLEDSEGAFLLCGFALALAEHHQGDDYRAVRHFERNRAACGPAALLAEEYDIRQRQLRGNLPQAFVHALLLECAGLLPADLPGPPPGGTERSFPLDGSTRSE